MSTVNDDADDTSTDERIFVATTLRPNIWGS